MVVGMKIKTRIIRYLNIAIHCVPFLGNWLLMRQLDKAYAEYKESVDQLTAIKAGEMTFRETGMNVSFESWIAPHLAASAYEMLDEKKANNYVELKLYHPKDKPGHWVTVLVQRWSGKTPGEKAAEAIEERDSALARVAELERERDIALAKEDEMEDRAIQAERRIVMITAPKDGDITAVTHSLTEQRKREEDADREYFLQKCAETRDIELAHAEKEKRLRPGMGWPIMADGRDRSCEPTTTPKDGDITANGNPGAGQP